MYEIISAQKAVNYAMLQGTCKVYETSEFKFRGAYGFNIEIHAEENLNSKMTVYITDEYIDRAVIVKSRDGELMFAYCDDMDYWDTEAVTLGDDKKDMTKDENLMEFYKSLISPEEV